MRVAFEPTFTLTPTARAAVKAFRDAKPWRGSPDERAEKFKALHRELCRAYDLETVLARDDRSGECVSSGFSHFDQRRNRIVSSGRRSVVTYLFLFGLAVGQRRAAAMAFARQTFAHFFPRSFAGCVDAGGMLVRA